MVSSGPFQSCDVSIITPFFCVTTEATFYIPSQRRLYLIIQKIQLSIISELHKELQHQKTNKLCIRVLHPITRDLEKNDHRLLNKSNTCSSHRANRNPWYKLRFCIPALTIKTLHVLQYSVVRCRTFFIPFGGFCYWRLLVTFWSREEGRQNIKWTK